MLDDGLAAALDDHGAAYAYDYAAVGVYGLGLDAGGLEGGDEAAGGDGFGDLRGPECGLEGASGVGCHPRHGFVVSGLRGGGIVVHCRTEPPGDKVGGEAWGDWLGGAGLLLRSHLWLLLGVGFDWLGVGLGVGLIVAHCHAADEDAEERHDDKPEQDLVLENFLNNRSD